MNPFEFDEKRKKFLVELYEMAEGERHEVSTVQLCKKLGIEYKSEASKIGSELKNDGLIDYGSFNAIRLTHEGIKEARNFMKIDYIQKELKILNELYEMSNSLPEQFVLISDLAKAVDMPIAELNSILNDLERRKGLVGGIDHFAWLLPSGVEEVERKRKYPDQATSHFPANITIHNITVQGDNKGNIMAGGQQNTQQLAISINPDFDNAIANILEIIKSSTLTSQDKQEFQNDIEAIKNLALQATTSQSIERAKKKIEYLDLALKATDIALKVSPYFPALYGYFEKITS